MNTKDKVAVCSRSFSSNEVLRDRLLSRYKYVTFNDYGLSLSGDSLVSFLNGHSKAITALESITEEVISQLPELKVISKYGVGLDMIDMNSLNKYGVKLGWEAGVNKRSVSELTLSLIISSLRHVRLANNQITKGRWKQHIGSQLTNKRVGIIGCGNVGKDLIKLLKPFNCQIYVYDIRDYSEFYKENNIITLDLDDLLSQSDIVSLHIPLDKTTRNIINAERLALMKPTGVIINTARGGLIEEKKLKSMLIESKIVAAAFDVFEHEPPQDQELLELENFISTSHIGGSSIEAIIAMGKSAIDGLDSNSIPKITKS